MQAFIERLLNEYVNVKSETFANNSFGVFVRNEIPKTIYGTGLVNKEKFLISGSVGQGNWAMIPWVCIFNRSITTSATKGVYIVYLLSKDGNTLYLTFNQGCTDLKNKYGKKEAIRLMRENANSILEKIGNKGFRHYDSEMSLGENLTELGEMYEKGTILYKAYRKGNVPSEDILLKDLSNMMDIYNEYVSSLESKDDTEIVKFKQLLEIFVKQLRINNDILPGEKVYGQGYRDMPKIRNIYKDCREFDGYILELALQAGFHSYDASNYVHLRESWVNIVPIFDELPDGRHDVSGLQVVNKPDNKVKTSYPSKTVTELGLFDGKTPNETLEAFFNDFKTQIDLFLKIGNFDSWKIIDENTAVKTCDKSFFDHNGSGVPKGICWFFDAEDMPNGASKELTLIFNGITYIGKLRNDTTDRRRIQILWNADLGKNLENYKATGVKATFKKISKNTYEITMSEEGEKMTGTILENVIEALKSIGGKGRYNDIYVAYENITNQDLTDSKKAGIRACIERNSSDSDVFNGTDIFYSVEGKGKGVWGLRNFVSQSKQMTTKQKIESIKDYIATKGFNYEGNLIENFYLSLKSKPFVILAGTSGTGKTRLVKLFAEAVGAKMKLVPVRPDWSDSSDLFGHTDLSGKFQPGAIIDFIKQAEWDKETPYFLCLDEMNLARVEYYLSDFLSIIETRDRKDNGDLETDPMIDVDYYKDNDAAKKYGRVFIPDNLYIIGTVNMDETTFPFSKKVLDRANTIEFSFVNLMAKPGVNAVNLPRQLSENNSFLKTEYLYLSDCNNEDIVDSVCFELNEFNTVLLKANLHVGYRVRDEITFYMMNNKNSDLLKYETAFDNEIMQKILPRIQGSSRAIKDVLSELFIKCAGDYTGLNGATDFEQMQFYIDSGKYCKYPNSANKLKFMMRRYEEDGFTSYWL